MLEFELVLPAYNEALSLPNVIEHVVRSAQQAGFAPDSFALILVNNGSSDGSQPVLEELRAGPLGPWFRVIHLEVNRGYGHGLWQGLIATSAPFVGWSHADLQCDPQNAFRALEIARRDPGRPTLVKGVRSGRNWKDRFVSLVFEALAGLIVGLPVNEINAQPKVFPRELLSRLTDPPATFAFDLYALYHAVKAGYRVETLAVLFPPRVHGMSKWAATFFGRYRTILGIIAYMRRLARTEGRL